MRFSIINEDGHLTRAGKAIWLEPENGDDSALFGMVTRSAVSSAGVELDDSHDADWLADKAQRMADSLISGWASKRPPMNSSLSGVYLHADASGVIISIPSAEQDLDADGIVRNALAAIERQAAESRIEP